MRKPFPAFASVNGTFRRPPRPGRSHPRVRASRDNYAVQNRHPPGIQTCCAHVSRRSTATHRPCARFQGQVATARRCCLSSLSSLAAWPWPEHASGRTGGRNRGTPRTTPCAQRAECQAGPRSSQRGDVDIFKGRGANPLRTGRRGPRPGPHMAAQGALLWQGDTPLPKRLGAPGQ